MNTTVSVVKLSSKNQIVLSKAARNALGVKAHDKVVFLIDAFGVSVMPERKSLLDYAGVGQRLYRQFGGGQQFLKKERASWQTKDRQLQKFRSGKRGKK